MKIKRFKTGSALILFSLVIGIIAMSFVIAPKETLKEIALRKQAEGKIIPVYMHPVKLMHKGVGADASGICALDGATPIKDQFGTDYTATAFLDESIPEGYFALANSIAQQLNDGLGTTAFKAVFANELPMKTIKFLGREDEVADWWQTEYDVLINISAVPAYVTKSVTNGYNSYFEFSSMLSTNTVEEGKQALGNLGMPIDLGALKTDLVDHEACLSSLGELKEKISDPEALAPDCSSLGSAAVSKFIEKENKKFDKAQKK